jgi:hypothetical protein
VQSLAEAASGITLPVQPWQKDRLVKLRFIGKGALRAIAVGRGTAAGPLHMGVEPKLLRAMEVLCAPHAKALKEGSPAKACLEAAALLLLLLYLDASLSSFRIDSGKFQVRLASSRRHLCCEDGEGTVAAALLGSIPPAFDPARWWRDWPVGWHPPCIRRSS